MPAFRHHPHPVGTLCLQGHGLSVAAAACDGGTACGWAVLHAFWRQRQDLGLIWRGVDSRLAGMTKQGHARLDPSSMPPAAMDTRMRGYDISLGMTSFACATNFADMTQQRHPGLDPGSMPAAAMDTRMRGYDDQWRA
jgi:hypothetical protein